MSNGVLALVVSLAVAAPPSAAPQGRERVKPAATPIAWATSFEPTAVRSHLLSVSSVVVVAMGAEPDSAVAARVLLTALAKSGLSVTAGTPATDLSGTKAIAQLAANEHHVLVVETGGDPPVASVTIHGPDGAKRGRFWAEAGIPLSAVPIAPAPAAAPAPTAPVAADAALPGLRLTARLDSDYDGPVVLYQQVGQFAGNAANVTVSGEFARKVCTLPCTRDVDTRKGTIFYVGGDNVMRGKDFHLPDEGSAVVDVTPGRRSRVNAWLYGTTIPAGLLLGGGLPVALTTRSRPVRVGTACAVTAGVALAITGVVFALRNRTRVTVNSS